MTSCDGCQKNNVLIESLQGRIAGLHNALRIATNEPFEYSEMFSVGGPAGDYTIRAPFMGDCEYSVQQIVSGAQPGQILIASTPHKQSVDMTGVNSYQELSGFDGIISNLPSVTTIPSVMIFAPVRDSNNTLYVHVGTAAGGALFATIIFRQKRGVR